MTDKNADLRGLGELRAAMLADHRFLDGLRMGYRLGYANDLAARLEIEEPIRAELRRAARLIGDEQS